MTDTASVVVARLRAAGCVFAEDEARLLLAAAGDAGAGDAGAESSWAALDAMISRRVAGEPLEQVVGWAEFAGRRVAVDPGVFVPRRRSEFLVSVAGSLIAGWPATGSLVTGAPVTGSRMTGDATAPADALTIVDLCCGTGALGLAVAHELEERAGGGSRRPVELYAADLDPAATACARRNLAPAGGRVYHGDLFMAVPESLRGGVGVLICNAPYVPTAEIAFLPAEARDHEARVALDGGQDGLAVLRRVAAQAPAWLAPAGVLLVETSARQAPAMTAAMAAAGLTPVVHTNDEYGATVVTGTADRGAGP